MNLRDLKCPNAVNACNFSISGSIDPSGAVLPSVLFNPPILGQSLLEVAKFNFAILNDNNEYIPLSNLSITNSDFAWPIPSISYSPYKLNARIWAPISFNNIKNTSLPIIFVEFNSSKEFLIKVDLLIQSSISDKFNFSIFVSEEGNEFVEERSNQIFLSGTRQIVAFVAWHENLYATNFYNSPIEMMKQLDMKDLRLKTQQIEQYLPQVTVDKRLFLNLELVPAFALTRVIKSGELLTMGYCELNQRDSFWTTFVHLILFKEAEIKMINESCEGQLKTGKIPTTLLPLIERQFDIDITAYFVLRIIRFIRYYKDEDDVDQLAKKWYPYAKKAIEYLASLRDENNVPYARDYWADWKDVPGMNDRLYGPHFVLITKAAVKEFKWLSSFLKIESNNDSGDIQINAEPLWNGRFYQDIMRDGTSDERFHQDQMICELWNVCNGDNEDQKNRYELMLAQAEELENQFGLPETLPFYPAEKFGYPIGEYHNGGIWPWLSFADAAARIAAGHRKSGENLLLTVAKTDIISFGDLCSNEYHSGITGRGGGNNIQGWNSCAILPFSLYSSDPRNHFEKLLKEMRQ